MKSFLELTEEKTKKLAILFGRMNPPTKGHEENVEGLKSLAAKQGADHLVIASHSQDAKKNPLSHKDKIKYLGLGVPEADNHLSDEKSIKTPFQALQHLIEIGYTDVIMVVGQDRVSEFKNSIGNYVNHEDPDKSFELNSFDVVSAGERDPDADGAEGMSGTKMRQLAATNRFKEFKRGVPSNLSDKYARELFDTLRQSMKA